VNNTTIIVLVIVVAVFAFAWWQGHIRRLAEYWQETMEELKKCSWPTWTELKGSTTIIVITIGLLGIFTVVADEVFYNVFFKLLK